MVMSVKLQPAQKVESEYDEMDDVAVLPNWKLFFLLK